MEPRDQHDRHYCHDGPRDHPGRRAGEVVDVHAVPTGDHRVDGEHATPRADRFVDLVLTRGDQTHARLGSQLEATIEGVEIGVQRRQRPRPRVDRVRSDRGVTVIRREATKTVQHLVEVPDPALRVADVARQAHTVGDDVFRRLSAGRTAEDRDRVFLVVATELLDRDFVALDELVDEAQHARCRRARRGLEREIRDCRVDQPVGGGVRGQRARPGRNDQRRQIARRRHAEHQDPARRPAGAAIDRRRPAIRSRAR